MSNSTVVFKVCLTVPGQARKIVEIGAKDTVEDLYTLASDAFGAVCLSLKTGFPPKPLERSAIVAAQSVIANNDRLTVVLNQREESKAGNVSGWSKGKTTTKAKKTDSTTTQTAVGTSDSRTGRSQRAAAKAATESFADIIKDQDKLLKEQQKNTKRKRPTANTTARSPQQVASAAAARKLAKLPGRRLGDGVAVGGGPRKPKSSSVFRSQDDVSFALVNALESGGGGKVGQVLRGAMRSAISRQYDASRAVTRVSAVQAGKYNIASSAESSTLVVTFDKGIEGRGDLEETVDYIPREALEAVVTAIHGSDPESLRPVTLSQLSPRVFWSLLKETSTDDVPQRDVEMALQRLLPTLEWSFLKRRKQTLSEKAQENLRQERLASGEDEEANMERAAQAVQAVEHAMEHLHQFDQSQRRGRAAEAALARQHEDVWRLVTPTEQDEEELKECCGNDSVHVPKLLKLGIRNWRQLANEIPEKLAQKLSLDVATAEAWIDRAQQESVEEIIVEVCDNRADVVQALRDEARTGTPKDLANWRSMPDLLLETASSLQDDVTVEEIATWCQRAHDLLKSHEWLSWYATPVD